MHNFGETYSVLSILSKTRTVILIFPPPQIGGYGIKALLTLNMEYKGACLFMSETLRKMCAVATFVSRKFHHKEFDTELSLYISARKSFFQLFCTVRFQI